MIQWFARNGVAANLVAIILVVGGIASLLSIKFELFPQFSLDTISVRVPYPGAAPAEVEDAIVRRIEERIQDLEGIKEMRGVAQEGYGAVTVEVDGDYNVRELLDQIKSRIDSIDTFPPDAERPIVEENLIKREVLALEIHGQIDERSRKQLAERVRDDLLAMPGITQVDIAGVRDYEIAIEVSEDALRRFSLTFADVEAAVRRTSLDLPGGKLRTTGGEVLLRTTGQAYTGEEFGNIILRTLEDGSIIRIRDVATVVDGFTDTDLSASFNGEPSISLIVSEVGDQNPLDISKVVKAYVAEADLRMPEGVHLSVWRDSSFYLQGRLQMLIENAIIGFALVLTVLALFLRPSLALWVTIGIPISFLGSFMIMPSLDQSINLMSLYGFILVLGIVVDDAIVVGESVFHEFQENGPGVESAVRGTQAVAVPVTYAVLTTAVAFVPLLNLPGFLGKFIYAIPMVVIPTLLFSLVESKLVLPYHLSLCKVGGGDRTKINLLQKIQRGISDALERFIAKVYQPMLKWGLHYRYFTICSFCVLLALTVGLLKFGIVKQVPFPKVPSDYIGVSLTYPDGAPVDQTQGGIDRVVETLNEIRSEMQEKGLGDPIRHMNVLQGIHAFGGGPAGAQASNNESHLGEVIVELEKSEAREISAIELADEWRERVGPLPGIKKMQYQATAAGGQGAPIDVQILASQAGDAGLLQLRQAANIIKAELESFQGIFDISDSLNDSMREIKLRIKPEGEVLGLTQEMLGRQVRSAFFGTEAQRVQRGRDDVRVMVRYPEAQRTSTEDLLNMRIRTPDGREVPFFEVADVEFGYGYSSINRLDRHRVVNVTADADKVAIDLEVVKERLSGSLLPELEQQFPDLRFSLEGEVAEQREANTSLISSMILVLFVMYALMAIPFKSYLQPMIVMSVIPFGLIGAVFGHMLMDRPLSMLSNFGIIALTGVVVNDSLVLVDYVNQLRREKDFKLIDAVAKAGARRFRPIMLTSLTTFVGLCPILFEKSLQAQFLIPMAISLSFGVLFATFVTLFLVPCFYLFLEDCTRILKTLWRWTFGPTAKEPVY